ncbi:MAG TPA: transglycosylase family protein, partial [Acidimicrobiales bacterium]|nr:transglycosylase family protein [Acidimicrobiales bacterium]
TTDPPAPPTTPATTTPATTTPATTTPPATTAAPAADVHPPPAGGLWLELRECESGDNYQADTGNGYYGAYQFSWATWVDLGYPGRPDQEPYWMQDEAAQRLEAMDGWGQWPSCSAALGV